MSPTGRFDTIWTGRLLMRRWRDSDREPFADLNGDPETMRFFPAPISRAGSDALIDRIESCFDQLGYGLWALEVAATGEFIGFTGLNPMPDGVPGAGGVEIGWRLAKRAWHHGYATEAARAALGVAFDGVGVAEIWSMTAVLNQPSQAVMRRLGLTEVARFDHPRVPHGHPLQPHVTYHLARPQGSRPAAKRRSGQPRPLGHASAGPAKLPGRSAGTDGDLGVVEDQARLVVDQAGPEVEGGSGVARHRGRRSTPPRSRIRRPVAPGRGRGHRRKDMATTFPPMSAGPKPARRGGGGRAAPFSPRCSSRPAAVRQ
jgi:RimJ/RimL family protein N-acetyltransferase